MSNRKWYYTKADSQSRKKFAWHVLKEIFTKAELVGRNTSGRSNGKQEKLALNVEKLNIVREIVFYYWPLNPIEDGNKNDSKLWNEFKEAINSSLHGKKEIPGRFLKISNIYFVSLQSIAPMVPLGYKRLAELMILPISPLLV